jgi:hypothetical protein
MTRYILEALFRTDRFHMLYLVLSLVYWVAVSATMYFSIEKIVLPMMSDRIVGSARGADKDETTH